MVRKGIREENQSSARLPYSESCIRFESAKIHIFFAAHSRLFHLSGLCSDRRPPGGSERGGWSIVSIGSIDIDFGRYAGQILEIVHWMSPPSPSQARKDPGSCRCPPDTLPPTDRTQSPQGGRFTECALLVHGGFTPAAYSRL